MARQEGKEGKEGKEEIISPEDLERLFEYISKERYIAPTQEYLTSLLPNLHPEDLSSLLTFITTYHSYTKGNLRISRWRVFILDLYIDVIKEMEEKGHKIPLILNRSILAFWAD